nr:prephenate dehydratase [Candidatus Acidoferrales bacterium]
MSAVKLSRVAFQGERGAFSEQAAIDLLGEHITPVPRPTFESLFAAINDGAADLILAPIENALAGSVHRSYDLLLESNLTIAGEVVIPIVMNLIGAPGAHWKDVRSVESHPVALAQCERFFAENPQIRRIVAEDTAGSVSNVVRAGDVSRAAIAGMRAAEVYGGELLREHLEDDRANFTRFLLLSPDAKTARGANKLSLVLRLAHQPGSLQAALEPFAKRQINLLRIESRPIPGHPWEYRFYLDLAASTEDAKVKNALEELRKFGHEVRVLGCYVAALTVGVSVTTERN